MYIYISGDVIFMEHIYPYEEHALTNNLDAQITLGLLGSSPTTIKNTIHTSPPSPPSILPSLVTSTSSQQSVSSSALLEQSQSSLVSSESHNSYYFSQNLSLVTNSSKISTTGHIPSSDPLSPSNLDSHNSHSHVKTRRLSNILHTIDSKKECSHNQIPSSYLSPCI